MASTFKVTFDVETKKAIKSIEGFSRSTDAALAGLTRSVGVLGAAFVGFVSAGALVAGLKKSVEAAVEAEQSITKLNNALALSGEFSEAQSQRFQELASQLQASAGISDEVILNQVAIAKAFGVTNDAAEKLIKAAVDLSAATGISLDEAVQHLGKSFDGTAGRLNELVPGIRSLTAEQLKAGAAVDLVAQKFQGSADAIGQTFGGALNRASLSFGDLFEELGRAIIATPAVVEVINLLIRTLGQSTKWIKSNEDAIRNLVKFGLDILGTALNITAKIFKVFDGVVIDSLLVFNKLEEGIYRVAVAVRSLPGIKVAVDARETARLESAADNLVLINKLIKEQKAASDAAVDEFVSGYDKAISSVKKLGAIQKNQSKDAVAGLKDQQEAAKKAAAEMKKQLSDVGSLVIGSIAAAAPAPQRAPQEEAATKLVVGLVGKLGDAILPGLGPVFSELANMLSRGGEAVRQAIEGIVQAIPQIVSNILLAIDDMLLAIVGSVDELVAGLLAAIPEFLRQFLGNLGPVIFTLIESLVQAAFNLILSIPDIILGLLEGADKFIEGIITGIPKLIERLPEIVVAFVQQLIAKLPEIITALILQLPRLVVSLASQMPMVAIRLALALVEMAPTIAIEFVKSLIAEAPRFIDALWNGIKSLVGLGSSKDANGNEQQNAGGVVGAAKGVVSGLTGAVSKIGKFLGFADGGMVPSGFPNDSALIRATSGELVIDRSDTDRLSRFLDAQDSASARFEQEATDRPQQLTINLMVGEKQLAQTILDLNRQGFRLA